MFKSVFTKFITVFVLIITISFVILTSIIASQVNSYAIIQRENSLRRAAESMMVYIGYHYMRSEYSSFEDFIVNDRDEIQLVSDIVNVNIDDFSLIISDNSGRILKSNARLATELENVLIPPSVSNVLLDGGAVLRRDDLDGLFKTVHLYYGIPVWSSDGSGKILGTVIVCTANPEMDNLLNGMIKTIVMSSLWIMLAALIAVYFLSEKIIGPLKSMSIASKKFANGQFDVRVPVVGHDEVAKLAVAFNNMATSLSNLEEMRRSFMANVSHDLKTPMTTIAGFIDGILVGAIPPEKHEYYLGVIAAEVRRLSRLVETLLDISRMQAGERKFNMASFDVCELARQILISFEQKIEQRNLDVEFDCEEDKMFAYADRDAIHQILYNVCDNAVKFAKDGGAYKVTLIYNDDKKIQVSVYNEGVGIPEEDLPFVFERFYKSDKSRGLDKTGVGLGLYIAKTIIEAHGEKIWCESESGSYCRFTFTLAANH